MATVGIALMGTKAAALAGAATTVGLGIGATALAAGTVGSLYEGRRARKMQERAMTMSSLLQKTSLNTWKLRICRRGNQLWVIGSRSF